MAFHDLLADRQSDTSARVLRARVQALEEHKDTFNVLRLDANPVVAHAERAVSACGAGRYMHHGRETRLLELDGVGDQILKELVELQTVRTHTRQIAASDSSCRVLYCRAEVGNDLI